MESKYTGIRGYFSGELKAMKKKIRNWLFKDIIEELNNKVTKLNFKEEELKKLLSEARRSAERVNSLLGNIDVSVDVHQYSSSWAVISLQGGRSDYIKFVDLGDKDIREISSFLRNFDRNIKVDAVPLCGPLMEIRKTK